MCNIPQILDPEIPLQDWEVKRRDPKILTQLSKEAPNPRHANAWGLNRKSSQRRVKPHGVVPRSFEGLYR